VKIGRRGIAWLVVLAVVGCAPSVTPSPPGSPSAGPGGPSPTPNASVSPSSAAVVASPPVCPGPAGPEATSLLGAPGWWRDRVFYEVFVRSFADSDGDGIGDLRGLIGRLDQLNDGNPATTTDLGVTALWLMPTFPSPSYHGYDVTDYRGVNPDYGTLADMRALVAAAHQRGMAVILDLPLNHTSDQDPWFVDSRKAGSTHADWYVWSSTPEGSNWYPDGKRYYYAAFGADLPDLNVKDPAVTAELTKDASYWLTDVGVDGFRLDAAKYMIEDGPTTQNTPETHAWLGDLRRSLQATTPGALTLGEVWDTSPISSSYVPDALDMTFDFTVASAYVDAAGSGDGSSVGRILARITTLYPPGGFGAFLTNHDQDRVASTLKGDPAKLRLAAEMLLTGPGVPFVYYGEEIGMTGAKPDERIRTPMRWDASEPAAGFSTHAPWETLSSDPSSVNVAAESADPASLWSGYRDLVALRAAHPALAEGSYVPVVSDAPNVTAAIRTSPTETALVLTNVGDAPATPTLSLANGPLCGTPSATVAYSGDLGSNVDAAPSAPAVSPTGGFTAWRPVSTIPPRTVMVVDLAP
jgi:alpha-amylase